jgi:cell division protein ZapA
MRYDVEIFGHHYALRADADEEHVRKVADLVDSKMREVADGSRSVSTLQIAVLAALDIASEFVQTRTASEQLTAMVETRSETMARRIGDLIPEVCTP